MLGTAVVTVMPADDQALQAAVRELRAGRPVGFPTETVYGLGADAGNPDAVAEVFRLKGRPLDHPLIVHLHSAEQLGGYVAFADERQAALAARLVAAFWPGPLTLVLPARAEVPRQVTGGQSTVALRSPRHPVAQRLLAAFGGALVAPSANRFGRISPTTAAHVASEFDAPDHAGLDLLVLDGGPCEVGIESTILDLTSPVPRILRPGAVTAADLAAVLETRVAAAAGGLAADPAAPAVRVPGSLDRHYAPIAPTQVVTARQLADARLEPGAAVLTAGLEAPAGFPGVWIALPAEPEAYARGLYAALRALDAAAPSAILLGEVPAGPSWDAVRDRLRRAACTHEPRLEAEADGKARGAS